MEVHWVWRWLWIITNSWCWRTARCIPSGWSSWPNYLWWKSSWCFWHMIRSVWCSLLNSYWQLPLMISFHSSCRPIVTGVVHLITRHLLEASIKKEWQLSLLLLRIKIIVLIKSGYPCNVISSQCCDLSTNRIIFCSKSHLFLSQWEWDSKTKQPITLQKNERQKSHYLENLAIKLCDFKMDLIKCQLHFGMRHTCDFKSILKSCDCLYDFRLNCTPLSWITMIVNHCYKKILDCVWFSVSPIVKKLLHDPVHVGFILQVLF